MSKPLLHRSTLPAALAAVLACSFAGSAVAQAPVPGEKWRQTMKMEMDGVAVPMPAMSMEMCVPTGRAMETLSGPPPDQKNCTMTNVRQSGNSFSADMECTGKEKFKGRIESTQISPTQTRGKLTMVSDEGTMTMTMDSEKVGGACDAAELERRMNRLLAKVESDTAAMRAAQCADGIKQIRQSPANVASTSYLFIGTGAGAGSAVPPTCTDATQKKEWCAAVGSRPGFRSLSRSDRDVERQNAAMRQSGATGASMGQPVLLRAMSACGLARDVASIETYRKKLIDSAEAEADWGFFLAEASAERSDAIGKANCTGRAFTEAKDPRYQDFCARWGARLAGRETPEDGGAASASASGTAASGAAAGSSTQAGSGTETVDGTQPAQPATATDVAKDALKKGTKALKGIFGGGN